MWNGVVTSVCLWMVDAETEIETEIETGGTSASVSGSLRLIITQFIQLPRRADIETDDTFRVMLICD